MKGKKACTPEQIAGTEKIINILLAMPNDVRGAVAIAASAYIDGFLAGQAFKEDKEDKEGRQVLANQ